MRFTHLKEFIIQGANDIAMAFGFDSWSNMVNNILMYRDFAFTSKVAVISFFIGLLTMFEDWVFAPAYTYFVFIAVSLAESICGTIKNVWKEKKKFDLDKAIRIVPKVIAHTFALSTAWHMSQADILFAWMPSAVFVYFTSQNFLKTLLHLVDLGWMDGDFANFIRDKFTAKNFNGPSDKADSKQP